MDLDTDKKDEKKNLEMMGLAYGSLITALTSAAADITTQSILNFIRDDNFDVPLKKKMMPYLYTAGFLSFAGRDVTKETVCATLEAAGIKPEDDLLDMLAKTGVKSHAIYAYAFYYLLSSGKDASEENILNVVTALGLKADKATLVEAIKEINTTE